MTWEWGEVYIWGGVTWRPDPAAKPPQRRAPRSRPAPGRRPARQRAPAMGLMPGEAVAKPGERVLSQTRMSKPVAMDDVPTEVWGPVWMCVAEQYPVASREGAFAGTPLSPMLANIRFQRLIEVLDISTEEGLELARQDSTPLLVPAEGVASAFSLLVGISSRKKALELVRCHPGLLVGGVRSLREGVSAVTSALVDVLFAGRLLKVLEDRSRDNAWKLAEIELYAWVASSFKPVMDLVQRRTSQLGVLLALPVLAQLPLFTTSTMEAANSYAYDLSVVGWAMGFGAWALGISSWGWGLGSWFLGLVSWVVGVSSWLLGISSWALTGLAPVFVSGAPAVFGVSADSLSLGAWFLGTFSWALSLGAWVASLF